MNRNRRWRSVGPYLLILLLAIPVGLFLPGLIERHRSHASDGDFTRQFDAAGPATILYVTATCAFCAKAKRHLERAGIRHVVRSLDGSSPDPRYAELGLQAVPVLVTPKRIVVGYFPDEFDQAVAAQR